jgi:hypothetical protein
MKNNLKILLLLASFFIVSTLLLVLYFWVCNKTDNFVVSPIRGRTYDPDIEKLSGGMAGFSYSPYYRWSYSLYPPEEYYPYFGNPYSDEPYYLPNSIHSRNYHDHPYTEMFYGCDRGFCSPIYDPVFDNPRVQELWMSGE